MSERKNISSSTRQDSAHVDSDSEDLTINRGLVEPVSDPVDSHRPWHDVDLQARREASPTADMAYPSEAKPAKAVQDQEEEENPFDFKTPLTWNSSAEKPVVDPFPPSPTQAAKVPAGAKFKTIGVPAFEALYKLSLAESSDGKFVRLIEFPMDARGQRMIKRIREATSESSPFFVNVLEMGTTGFGYYYVEDCGDWQTLREALSYARTLDESTVARLGSRLAEALEAMQAMGIQHRNLCPSTILVNFDLSEVKIRGFELAVKLKEGQTVSSLAGGLPYMAPEAADRKAGTKSDIYSVGATLCEALTGRPPFAVSSPACLLHVVQHLGRIKPSSYLSSVSYELDDVIANSTAFSPSSRFLDKGKLDEFVRNSGK